MPPLAPLAKFVSEERHSGPQAKPWDGPPVLLGPGLAEEGAERAALQAAPSVAGGDAAVQGLTAALEAAREEAARWRSLHGQLRALMAE